MKVFITSLILITSLLISTAVADEAGVFYDGDANGEGAAVFTQGTSFTAFIYTYSDGSTELPPVVSPAPPRIPNDCPNCTTWYVAQSTDFDGSTATGEIYSAEAIYYPESFNGEVGAVEQVGDFTATRSGSGWSFSVEYVVNPLVDLTASLYSEDLDFPDPLIIQD